MMPLPTDVLFNGATDVGLIIYDLDGTLYEEPRYFSHFAELLKNALPAVERAAFWHDMEAIWADRHPLRIGRAYDGERDLVLAVDAAYRVEGAWTWDGEPVAAARVASLYPDPVVFDNAAGPILAVGDGWWIPIVGAGRRGLWDSLPYYVAAKEAWYEDEHWPPPVPGLAESMAAAGRAVTQVVVTNTHRSDAEVLLARLGLAGTVAKLYASSNKPTASARLFADIAEKWGVAPRHTVSVGDNFFNDVAPALGLGMRGVLVDGVGAYRGRSPFPSRMARVDDATELIPWLNLLAKGVDERVGTKAGR